MRLLSEANVARRWESWGEAARRRRGGAGDIVWLWAFVGDEEFGDAAANGLASEQQCEILLSTHLFRSFRLARR